MFPDARFIFLYRDPYKTVESFYRFFHEVLPVVQVQSDQDGLSRERLASVYADMIRQYFIDKDKIPHRNLVEIKYEDFSKHPVEAMESIFNQLGMPGFEENRLNYSEYMAEISGFQQTSYEITPETIQWVNEFAGDLVDRLGYPRQG